MTAFDVLPLRNRRAVPLADVPMEAPPDFRAIVIGAVRAGWRLVALFGTPEPDGRTLVLAILAHDTQGRLGAVATRVTDRYEAFTPECPEAHRFECEMAEQCGLHPDGHPGLTPVRRHPPDHAREGLAETSFDREAYPFVAIEGGEVHEVAVGPVHAGIIEPGHFRFQAHGETVLHLDIMLGYQHRGVERLLESRPWPEAVLVAESIAGDTVIGHASAACGAVEAVARCRKTPRAQAVRGIALELERLANHIGDLGAIAGDIAYHPAAAYFGRMRGECLNLLMTISGNRYGRGLIRPGGTLFDLTPSLVKELQERLRILRRELGPVGEQMLRAASVEARLEGVGVVTQAQCQDLGLVGVAARACEVPRDVRHDHPYGLFRFAHIPVATAWAGDVMARVMVRWLEVRRSLDFVVDQLGTLPRGVSLVECGTPRPGELVVALEEGWRGEIAHILLTDAHGATRRHKVVDPSFRNWAALAPAMVGQQISDFPLCNKSFNLSYAGHDL